jgi:predicted nucleic acid-binding protein
MLVVADTSPINYLILIQYALLLSALYTHVIIPQPCSKSFKTLKLPWK